MCCRSLTRCLCVVCCSFSSCVYLCTAEKRKSVLRSPRYVHSKACFFIMARMKAQTDRQTTEQQVVGGTERSRIIDLIIITKYYVVVRGHALFSTNPNNTNIITIQSSQSLVAVCVVGVDAIIIIGCCAW